MGPRGSVGGWWDTGGQCVVNRALGVSRWFMDTGGQLVGGGTLGVSRWLMDTESQLVGAGTLGVSDWSVWVLGVSKCPIMK